MALRAFTNEPINKGKEGRGKLLRYRTVVKRTKPVIGLTCEVRKLKRFFSEFELLCDYHYIRAILRAGGIPILLPVNFLKRDVSKLVDLIDGLVITGGADVDPTFYGERSSEKVKPMYRGRTYFDIRLFKAAQKRKIPILAICYGMQLVNVIYGGTLHHDIRSEIKGSRLHHSRKNPHHRADVQEGSFCHQIFRKKSFVVHSHHHQAVKRLGKGLKITAISEDGIPEAIEGPTNVISVQWHPERQPKDIVQRRVFRSFVQLARKMKKNRI